MTPYYEGKWVTIYYGDCREILPQLDKASAIVTDPPYELGFMGKSWDSKGVSFQSETWEIIRKSCLSGAMLLSFGGTRTFHRIACAIEDAGWEIRDTVMWVYGSGFPKSLDISKAIDKHGGKHTEYTEFAEYIKAKREEKGLTLKQLNEYFGFVAGCNWWEAKNSKNFRVPNNEDYPKLKKLLNLDNRFDYLIGVVGEVIREDVRGNAGFSNEQVPRPWKEKIGEPYDITTPATPEAQLWNGYGTALKPAYEPIILAMNPLDGTFANNALKHGVAGLNIDECRIPYKSGTDYESAKGGDTPSHHQLFNQASGYKQTDSITQKGRFPANFIHDGSQMVMELFPQTSTHKGIYRNNSRFDPKSKGWGYESNKLGYVPSIGDNGSAARFFYCAKASKAERDRGCEGLEDAIGGGMQGTADKTLLTGSGNIRNNIMKNNHPTVKPLALMTYLVKLVKMPEYNLIIDSFCGSGTTLLACIKLAVPCIGIDNDEKSCEIAAKRCCQEVMELV